MWPRYWQKGRVKRRQSNLHVYPRLKCQSINLPRSHHWPTFSPVKQKKVPRIVRRTFTSVFSWTQGSSSFISVLTSKWYVVYWGVKVDQFLFRACAAKNIDISIYVRPQSCRTLKKPHEPRHVLRSILNRYFCLFLAVFFNDSDKISETIS